MSDKARLIKCPYCGGLGHNKLSGITCSWCGGDKKMIKITRTTVEYMRVRLK